MLGRAMIVVAAAGCAAMLTMHSRDGMGSFTKAIGVSAHRKASASASWSFNPLGLLSKKRFEKTLSARLKASKIELPKPAYRE
jgi:hypothetical protein